MTWQRIVIRNRAVEAELVYVSGRGDYAVYLRDGKTYMVRAHTCAEPVTPYLGPEQ